jgi:predicted site-specific integrase-resolvase
MRGSCEAVAVQKQKDKVIYTRVSSPAHHQRGDFITDSASGINFQRRGLKTILDRAHKGTLDELVVAYKDRLCRFTFDLVRDVLARSGCKLVVLGQENESGGEAELADDKLSIADVFVGKGGRQHSIKPRKQRKAAKEEAQGCGRRGGRRGRCGRGRAR